MSAPVDRWKLGLFVVVAIAVLLGAMTWLGMARLQRKTHEAYAFFDEPLVGLEEGSPVRFRGVPIGVVAGITVAPDKKHLAVRTALYDDKLIAIGLDPARLDAGETLPADMRAQVVTSMLTQTSFLLVDFFPAATTPVQRLPFPVPAATIPTVPNTFRNIEEGLRDLLRDLPALMRETSDLVAQARNDLAVLNLPLLGQRAASALQAADETLRNLDRLEAMQAATRSLGSVEALVEEWRAEEGPVRQLGRELGAVATELRQAIAAADAAGTAAGLRGAGAEVGSAGREIAALTQEVRAELPALRAALSAVERLAGLLERDPGALLHGRGTPSSPLRKE